MNEKFTLLTVCILPILLVSCSDSSGTTGGGTGTALTTPATVIPDCQTHPDIYDEKWGEHLQHLRDMPSSDVNLSGVADAVSGNIAILNAAGILTASNNIDPFQAATRFYSS